MVGKAAENDFFERRVLRDELPDRGNCNSGCSFFRVSVNAGADTGKRDRLEVVFCCQLKASSIAGSQKFRLAAFAAVPDRADGVNHMPGRQPVTPGDLCVAGAAAVELPAFL